MPVILALLLNCGSLGGFSCQCIEVLDLNEFREANWEYATKVFVGEIISVTEYEDWTKEGKGTYQIKVLESFKGTNVGEVLAGKVLSSCSITPNIQERWLVYATITHAGKIEVTRCGLSRSFSNPSIEHYRPHATPPPPTKDELMDVDIVPNSEEQMAKVKLAASGILEDELEWLRRLATSE